MLTQDGQDPSSIVPSVPSRIAERVRDVFGSLGSRGTGAGRWGRGRNVRGSVRPHSLLRSGGSQSYGDSKEESDLSIPETTSPRESPTRTLYQIAPLTPRESLQPRFRNESLVDRTRHSSASTSPNRRSPPSQSRRYDEPLGQSFAANEIRRLYGDEDYERIMGERRQALLPSDNENLRQLVALQANVVRMMGRVENRRQMAEVDRELWREQGEELRELESEIDSIRSNIVNPQRGTTGTHQELQRNGRESRLGRSRNPSERPTDLPLSNMRGDRNTTGFPLRSSMTRASGANTNSAEEMDWTAGSVWDELSAIPRQTNHEPEDRRQRGIERLESRRHASLAMAVGLRRPGNAAQSATCASCRDDKQEYDMARLECGHFYCPVCLNSKSLV
jgi:hypothetical protein